MLNAAIIGCGNISGFLDTPSSKDILTHAHAYIEHPNTKLISVCDPLLEQRLSFINRWGKNICHYESIQELLSSHTIDIISICSPTPFHYEAMLLALKEKSIKTIICEKPFVQTQEELDHLSILLRLHPKKVLLNFMRRFDPSIQKLAHIIDTKELGNIISFNGKFTKGLYHNGSHMLELIEHLCGDITSLSSQNFTLSEDDFYGIFLINCSKIQGLIQNFRGDNYALFELEIILTKGRILIKDSGHTIHIETVEPSDKYKNYFKLKHTQSLDDTMSMNLLHSLNSALCTNTSAFDKHLRLSQKLLDIKKKLPSCNTLTWDNNE